MQMVTFLMVLDLPAHLLMLILSLVPLLIHLLFLIRLIVILITLLQPGQVFDGIQPLILTRAGLMQAPVNACDWSCKVCLLHAQEQRRIGGAGVGLL